MADVMVTGGEGVIDLHLVDAHLRMGKSLIELDGFSTGRREDLPGHGSEPALDGVPAGARLRIVRGDVSDEALLDELAWDGDIGVVFHLAEIASLSRAIKAPLETLSVNTEGSLRLVLSVARSLPDLERFVFASSAAVYGGSVVVPTHESVQGVPDSPYGLEKTTVERYLARLHACHGLPTVAARFCNVFGLRQDPTSPYPGMLSIASRAASEGGGLVVPGDREQPRDFVYVEDVVLALLTLARDDRGMGGAFNVGTGREASLNDVVYAVESVTGRRLDVEQGPPRPGDVRRSVANALAIHDLGWVPRWTLHEGLAALMSVPGHGLIGDKAGLDDVGVGR